MSATSPSTAQLPVGHSVVPPALRKIGWRVRRDNESGKFFGENERLSLRTELCDNDLDAVGAARVLQTEYDGGYEDEAAPEASVNPQDNIPQIGQVETVLLDPNLIRTDGGTQVRSKLNDATVEAYAEAMRAGDDFPAIVVFYDGRDYWPGDGFHRHAATLRAELSEIKAEVRAGTRRDAILYAVGANARHGLRRTDDDKRRAVETLLRDEEWAKWSNREIARKCDVTHTYVGNVREELSGSRSQMEVTARRGDSTYTVKTENIGTNQKAVLTIDDLVAAVRAQDGKFDSVTFVNQGFTDEQILKAESLRLIKREFGLLWVVEPAGATSENTHTSTSDPAPGQAPASAEENKEGSTTASAGSTSSAGNLLSTVSGVAAMVEAQGPISLLDLEGLGCERVTINLAERDGLIRRDPDQGGKFVLAKKASAASAHEKKPTIEELLKGEGGALSFVWIKGVPGKVNVSVNLGAKPTDAVRTLIDASHVRGFSEPVMQLLFDELKKKGRTSKPKRQASTASSKEQKSGAKGKQSARAATKKAAPAAKKSAAKKPAAPAKGNRAKRK